MSGSAEVADVVIRLVAGDLEGRIARNIEGLAGAVVLPLALALQLDAAGAGHAFHDFRRAGVEGQGGRQDHADALLYAVGELDAVADALAVEIDIGLLDHADVIELGHAYSSDNPFGLSLSKPGAETCSSLSSPFDPLRVNGI